MKREQELIAAIKEADLKNVERLIKEGADLNYKDEEKSYSYTWPLLHHCIFKANSYPNEAYTTIAALLLQNGADIEAVDFAGETPAMFAIKYLAPDIFDLLIQKGANINPLTTKGYTMIDMVLDRYRHDQQLDLEHIADEKNKAVKAAIKKGEGESLTAMFKRIDALVKNGYDLQAGKFSAAVCAIYEIEKNKLPAKALYYLFDKGADPREYLLINEQHIPLFEFACDIKLPVEVLSEIAVRVGFNHIFEQYDEFDPLTIAVNNNNLELVKRLVELGADIHIQDDLPLTQACFIGNLEIVEFLVEQGANVNYDDHKGRKAIDFAEQEGYTEIVNYLKSKM